MLVLSVSQPWAQLIVRGMKLREHRPWETPFRGRVAIHAAKRAPAFNTAAETERNVSVAAWFADQGWHTRDDLLTLPRSAIVGTVEITDVRPAPPDEFGDATGEWIFTFAHPVEIPALGDIDGKQRLWTLGDVASGEVLQRERATGALPQGGTKAAARGKRGARGDAVVARLKRNLERQQAAERERLTPMPNAALEREFRKMFDTYCKANRQGGLTRDLERIRIAAPMRRWFLSDSLPRITLERLLREEVFRIAWQDEFPRRSREGILGWSVFSERLPDHFLDDPEGLRAPRHQLEPSVEDDEEGRVRRRRATRAAIEEASLPERRERPPKTRIRRKRWPKS